MLVEICRRYYNYSDLNISITEETAIAFYVQYDTILLDHSIPLLSFIIFRLVLILASSSPQNIDPTTTANLARFINHSCSPNLALFPVRVDSLVPAVGMFALRDIVEGEELGFDYAGMLGYGEGAQDREEQEHTERTKCLCGAGEGVCRGWLPFDEDL